MAGPGEQSLWFLQIRSAFRLAAPAAPVGCRKGADTKLLRGFCTPLGPASREFPCYSLKLGGRCNPYRIPRNRGFFSEERAMQAL